MENLVEIIQSITLFVLVVSTVLQNIKIKKLEGWRNERVGGFTDD